MATATEPEEAARPPSAGKGANREADRKRSLEQGRGGGGGAGANQGQKRRKKEVFIYGNYKNYYGYRVDGSTISAGKASGQGWTRLAVTCSYGLCFDRGWIDRNVGEDPRLEVFKKQWFEGKDCLDIGCNQGLVTIGLAMKFECRTILGVDIDSGLIETAKWNLRRISRLDKVATKSDKAQKSSNSPSQSSLEEAASDMSNGNHSNHKNNDLFKIVSFRRENFVENLHGCSEQYDTIICLSVTKWIHLNWGDDGLVTLFVKIWRLLRPGGIFIMEPQPWTSYRRNRLVSEVAKENFNNICIYPENFREVLLDKVGFRSVEMITDRLVGTVTGFDRPIEVYHK
ncbi:hypothetical protein ACP70R_001289 [Stipagrostis hirtigluma subsp. patula]